MHDTPLHLGFSFITHPLLHHLMLVLELVPRLTLSDEGDDNEAMDLSPPTLYLTVLSHIRLSSFMADERTVGR